MTTKCPTCTRVVKANEKGTQCSICDRWFHNTCQDLTPDEYKALQGNNTRIHWYCDSCQVGATSLYKKVLSLEVASKKMETKIGKLEEKIDGKPSKEEVDTQIAAKLDEALETKVEESIDEKMQGIENINSETICTKVVTEISERENRANNIIMHGIDKSNEEDGADRTREDWETIKQVLTEIGIEEQPGDQTTMKRLGERTEDKKRPILISLKDKRMKQEIITKARKLKDSEKFKQVGISHDLTKIQREELKNLREEARKKSTEETTYIVIGPPERRKIVAKKDRTQARQGAQAN